MKGILVTIPLGQFIAENSSPEPRSTAFSQRKRATGNCLVCGGNAFGKSRCPKHLAAIAKTMRDRRRAQRRAA